MRVLVAPCSFKGSLSAAEAARAIAAGVRDARPDAIVTELPLADGGDGTRAVLAAATPDATTSHARVPGADGEPVSAPLTWLAPGHALVESASVAGLPADADARDPWALSTAGVGALVRHALDEGATTVEVALGGTGTVDGGLGFLTALGARATDQDGAPCPPGGRGLAALAHLDLTTVDERVAGTRLLALADVDSRLLGPRGARLFMRQKGATPADADLLEQALGKLAALTDDSRHLGLRPGAGAAGGLGYAVGLVGGRLLSGSERVLELLGADAALAACELALTGEGRVDEQTARGKAPAAFARRAREHGVRVVALAGSRDGDGSGVFDEVHALTDDGTPVELAQREAGVRLRALAARVLP